MTDIPQNQPLSAGTILIAPGTTLPPDWQLEDRTGATVWRRVSNTFDHLVLEKSLDSMGWTFFFFAGSVSAAHAGFDRQKSIGAALRRITDAGLREGCNCVEIDAISDRSFLGMPYVSISAHLRHIQQGMVFTRQSQ